MTDGKLVAITHKDAWENSYQPGGCGIIPNKAILDEYKTGV